MVDIKFLFFIILFAIFIQVISTTSKEVVVQTKLGKLEGSVGSSRDGRNFYSWKGIPYGQIKERFQVAREVQPWEDVRKASEFGNACPHFDVVSRSEVGDEDCLFLNVYSPQIGKPSKLPVMVFFYQGGFERGKSDDYHPKYFMDEDVVLVTLNYRLGALGFLSTEDDVAPGNLGLKDQKLALQWVKENIQNFGGDSAKVTIFGCSAGGASVHYHILSPASKGLFKNAISQSGSALSPWAFQYNPKSNAEQLARFLDCPTKDSHQILDCLKSKSVSEIINAQSKFQTWHGYPLVTFSPSVEPRGTPNAFLTESPHSIMESGDFNRVPWIIGVNEDEGAMSSSKLIMDSNLTKEINDAWNEVAPALLMYNNQEASTKRRDEISTKIIEFYFGPDDIDEESWDSLTDMMSDRYFVYPVDTAARRHAKFSAVYPYVFSFPGGYSPGLRIYHGITEDMGVAHLDELPYMFNGYWGSPEYIDETQQETLHISKSLVKLWASFANDSVPKAVWGGIREWKPIPKAIGAKPINYLQISSKMSTSETDLQDRMKFWNQLALPNCTKPRHVVEKDEL